MTTYLSWFPTLDVGNLFGSYFGEDNKAPPSNTTTSKTTPERTTIPNENNSMFGFWDEFFGKTPKIEKYSSENLK